MKTLKENKKLIVIIISLILVMIIAIVIMFFVAKNINKEEFVGQKWNCGQKANTLILNNDKTLEWYSKDKTTFYIKGNFNLEELTKTRYELTIKSKERVLERKTYTNDYEITYDVRYNEDKTLMNLTNNTTKAKYKCELEK